MEVAPIPGIRALSPLKAVRESWQSSVLNIDASAKPEDGRGQGMARKAAGSQESEDEEGGFGLEEDAQPDSARWEERPERKVDYLA